MKKRKKQSENDHMKQCNVTGKKESKIKEASQDMEGRRAKTRTHKNEKTQFNLIQGKYLQGA